MIAIQTCGKTCDGFDATANVGSILFAGAFDPEQAQGSGRTDLVQNYYLRVPTHLAAGPAVLTVAHFGVLVEGVSLGSRRLL